MDAETLNNYINNVIPKIEYEMSVEKDSSKLVELYKLYSNVLGLTAPHDFISYNKMLELEEDKTQQNRGFYHHRNKHMYELFEAFNDMEVNDKYDMLLITLPPRVGKAQPLFSKILTPDGWSTMGDMVVGSRVMGDDGKIYNVNGVFPQGYIETYKITFSDGSEVLCCKDHLWRVQTNDDCKNGTDRVIDTFEMFKRYRKKYPKRYKVKKPKAMLYERQISDSIDMYSFGVNLARGIIGLDFIPDRYLYCEYDKRLDLLKGIMDASVERRRSTPTWSSKLMTESLAKSVCELIMGFGGHARYVSRVQDNKLYFIVSWSLPFSPFYRDEYKDSYPYDRFDEYLIIKSIDHIRREECQCISVDNPSSMYITDNYVQTHNTTTGIRFLSWIMGRHPLSTQLATSYSDSITSSFYLGVMEIILSKQFGEIFPEAKLVSQNAKRQEIWLKEAKRYPSITFAPVGGSVTGRSEAEKYLYCDDLVSGIEEALSVKRLEKLWQIYSTNFAQRKKDGCKEIHLATPWSVHDPISRLRLDNVDNPRCKIVAIPAYDDDEKSNFDFYGGFSSNYYKDIEKRMDSPSFSALYLCEPIEREGLLYRVEDMQTYFSLPDEKPDSIIAVCDSKGVGKDFVASPIGYVYGDLVYIEDVVFDNGLPATTIPKVAAKMVEHNVVRCDVEMNNGGGFYAENVNDKIKEMNGKTSIRTFFTSSNKNVKIITFSDFIIKHFIFKDPSMYSVNSDYAKFMKNVYSWSQTVKQQVDDAPDSLSMLANLFQDLTASSMTIIDRKTLGL